MAQKFVSDAIAKQKIVIFLKTGCPYCKMAEEQFQKLKAEFLAIDIDKRSDTEKVQDILEEMTGGRTVPRVFIKGKFIGGGTDVKKLNECGKLAKMIA